MIIINEKKNNLFKAKNQTNPKTKRRRINNKALKKVKVEKRNKLN